jgi:hypothetical protein
VTPDGAFVRRALRIRDLVFTGTSDDVRRIIDALLDFRLLVVSSSPDRPDAMVDLAHEAILRSWSRLREQREDFTQFLHLRSRLEIAAARWQERDKDPGSLYPRGEIMLLESQGQLQRHWSELGDAEREFVGASLAALAHQEWQAARQRRRNH